VLFKWELTSATVAISVLFKTMEEFDVTLAPVKELLPWIS
jgi:hypothetical protein